MHSHHYATTTCSKLGTATPPLSSRRTTASGGGTSTPPSSRHTSVGVHVVNHNGPGSPSGVVASPSASSVSSSSSASSASSASGSPRGVSYRHTGACPGATTVDTSLSSSSPASTRLQQQQQQQQRGPPTPSSSRPHAHGRSVSGSTATTTSSSTGTSARTGKGPAAHTGATYVPPASPASRSRSLVVAEGQPRPRSRSASSYTNSLHSPQQQQQQQQQPQYRHEQYSSGSSSSSSNTAHQQQQRPPSQSQPHSQTPPRTHTQQPQPQPQQQHRGEAATTSHSRGAASTTTTTTTSSRPGSRAVGTGTSGRTARPDEAMMGPAYAIRGHDRVADSTSVLSTSAPVTSTANGTRAATTHNSVSGVLDVSFHEPGVVGSDRQCKVTPVQNSGGGYVDIFNPHSIIAKSLSHSNDSGTNSGSESPQQTRVRNTQQHNSIGHRINVPAQRTDAASLVSVGAMSGSSAPNISMTKSTPTYSTHTAAHSPMTNSSPAYTSPPTSHPAQSSSNGSVIPDIGIRQQFSALPSGPLSGSPQLSHSAMPPVIQQAAKEANSAIGRLLQESFGTASPQRRNTQELQYTKQHIQSVNDLSSHPVEGHTLLTAPSNGSNRQRAKSSPSNTNLPIFNSQHSSKPTVTSNTPNGSTTSLQSPSPSPTSSPMPPVLHRDASPPHTSSVEPQTTLNHEQSGSCTLPSTIPSQTQTPPTNKIDVKSTPSPTSSSKEPVIPPPPTSPELEYHYIEHERQVPLREGDFWYLIDSGWFTLWREYTSRTSARPVPGVQITTPRVIRPPAINNSRLLGSNHEPRILTEDLDYVLVPQRVWEIFQCWYGGQPEVKRPVITVGIKRQLEVEVNLTQVVAILDKRKECLFVSKKSKYSHLKNLICEKFNLPSTTPVTLYICSSESSIKEINDLNVTLEESRYTSFDYIRVDTTGRYKTALAHGDMFGLGRPRRDCTVPGATGLYNLGNTCFMNAGIQCLSNTVSLTEYFLSKKYEKEINRENPIGSGGQLAIEYASLMREMWSTEANAIAPRGLKFKIGDFAPQFSGYRQHDCQELIAFLLDGLHEDLNRVKTKVYSQVQTPREPLADSVLAYQAWSRHKARNDSIVVDLFHGQLKSTLVCTVCERMNTTFDPFMFLSLPLASEAEVFLKVVLVEGNNIAVRYRLKISKDSRISEIKPPFFRIAKVSKPEELLAVQIHDHTLFKVFEDADPIGINEIYLYKIPTMKTLIPVSFLKKSILKTKWIGYPIFIPWEEHTVGRQFYDAIWGHVSKFSTKPDPLVAFSVYASRSSAPSTKYPLELEKGIPGDKDSLIVLWNNDSLQDDQAFSIVDHKSMQAETHIEHSLTIENCLRKFLQWEQLSSEDPWYCPKCKTHRQAKKKFDLWKLPPHLIIHFKRFGQGRSMFSRDKIISPVDIPIEGWDLTDFVPACDQRYIYDLYAVADHSGGLGGGHYTAMAKNPTNGTWYRFDDSRVSPANTAHIKSPSNYVLFFQQRGITTSPPSSSSSPQTQQHL